MKKRVIVLILLLAIVAAGGALYRFDFFSKTNGEIAGVGDIYVSSLSDIMGVNNNFSSNVFMGVVEGQETTGINKSSEREIETIHVSEGDTISKGTPLFTYKSDSLESQIIQYGFDIEGANLQISEYQRQIESLTKSMDKEKDKDKKEDISDQIEGVKMSIAMTQNTIEQTTAKIVEVQSKIDNSTVFSPVDGVVTSVMDENNPNALDTAFISILGSKEVRVKGEINEQNVWSINVNEPVILRSRIDENQTWTGVISNIDTEIKADTSSNDNNSSNKSTKYPFYITLDSSEGLMMGQHLYVEVGNQSEENEVDYSDGVYIYDSYVSYDQEGNAFVWAMDSKKKLEKRAIELGELDDLTGVYEVESGITMNDMLAYPMDDYEEGMSCMY